MTDRGHVDANLMGPPCLKLTCNQACRAGFFLTPPMGRGVPSALSAHDRHFLPIARIAADRRDDLTRARVEAAPSERQIFSLERASAPMICEQVGQALMRCVSLGDNQKPRRVF